VESIVKVVVVALPRGRAGLIVIVVVVVSIVVVRIIIVPLRDSNDY
jgi:hypothetical protein